MTQHPWKFPPMARGRGRPPKQALPPDDDQPEAPPAPISNVVPGEHIAWDPNRFPYFSPEELTRFNTKALLCGYSNYLTPKRLQQAMESDPVEWYPIVTAIREREGTPEEMVRCEVYLDSQGRNGWVTITLHDFCLLPTRSPEEG